MKLAKANNMPVASMPNELAANPPKPAKTMHEPSVVAIDVAPLKSPETDRRGSRNRQGFSTSAANSGSRHIAEDCQLFAFIGPDWIPVARERGVLRCISPEAGEVKVNNKIGTGQTQCGKRFRQEVPLYSCCVPPAALTGCGVVLFCPNSSPREELYHLGGCGLGRTCM